MRLVRLDAPLGVRQARLSEDDSTYLPLRDARIPGCDAPSIESPLSVLGAPPLLVPVQPSKIVCVGRNYRAHAAELGHDVPSRPLLFFKPTTALLAPGATILLPPDSEAVEHEAELGVVIGRRVRHLHPDDALAAVAGYCCVNDVTARDLQRRDGQFARTKGFDTFCPVGPFLRTGLDPRDLAVRCFVGAELRQDGRTSQLVFDVATLVAAISRIMTLLPGDLIATGTPAGVGPLADGDVVTVTIDGLGALINPVARDRGALDLAPPISEAR